jgi:RNA polymerase sigma-70 factor, ECF subfamily
MSMTIDVAKTGDAFALQPQVQGPWRSFIDQLAPLRPELFRYCLGLTGNVWDAEDLVQDTLIRVFGHMGKINAQLQSPRAYLIRSATHLWIDRIRRLGLERAHAADHAAEPVSGDDPAQALWVRKAAASLFVVLPPQERAAVLMKDVLDFSLEETAAMLKSSVGAVKSALHRGRARLKSASEAPAQPVFAPPREVVETFVKALTAKDFETIRAICLSDVSLDMVGGAAAETWELAKTAVLHAHMVIPGLPLGTDPRWEVVDYLGEPIAVGYRTKDGVEGINEIWRFDLGEGGVARLRLYCFTPEVIDQVASDLGVPALKKRHRSPPY